MPIVISLLLQVPPETDSVKETADPEQTLAGPVIVVGTAFTDTGADAVQPVPGVMVIAAVPKATPFTIPVDVPTEATELLLLLHVPLILLLRVVVDARHTLVMPLITGTGLTVNV